MKAQPRVDMSQIRYAPFGMKKTFLHAGDVTWRCIVFASSTIGVLKCNIEKLTWPPPKIAEKGKPAKWTLEIPEDQRTLNLRYLGAELIGSPFDPHARTELAFEMLDKF